MRLCVCKGWVHIKRAFTLNHSFHAPEIKDRGHIVFVLCNSEILYETLTLLITFSTTSESFDIFLVLVVTRPFRGYKHFWHCDLDLGVGLLFENVNLAYEFLSLSVRVFIFHMNIPCDKIFLLLVNLLTLTFDIFKKKHYS